MRHCAGTPTYASHAPRAYSEGYFSWQACKLGSASAVPAVLMDVCSKTPLHHAAEYGHVRVADRLVAFGADVNVTADDGCV